MKIIDGFEFVCVDGKTMAVSTGDATSVYRGVVSLNETAYEIWRYIDDGLSFEEIAGRLVEEYDGLAADDAMRYVREFAGRLIDRGILVEAAES